MTVKLTATITIGAIAQTAEARKAVARQIQADIAAIARATAQPKFARGLEERMARSASLTGRGHQPSGTLILELAEATRPDPELAEPAPPETNTTEKS